MKLIERWEGIDYYEGINSTGFWEIHKFISNHSYWAKGISSVLLARALKHSWNFSVCEGERLVAFSRLVTDYATFAYLADVFVLPDYRGRGIAEKMIGLIVEQEPVPDLRRIILATQDAHGLYEKFGFCKLSDPEIIMEISRKAEDIYK